MTDIFDKIRKSTGGPIGQYREKADGYFAFPKLEGELGPHMRFNGKEVLCWSLNNYLGLANHPEIRKIDAEAAARWGMAYPMGSRMLTGHTALHEKLEKERKLKEERDSVLIKCSICGEYFHPTSKINTVCSNKICKQINVYNNIIKKHTKLRQEELAKEE